MCTKTKNLKYKFVKFTLLYYKTKTTTTKQIQYLPI